MTTSNLRRASIHIGGIYASQKPAVVRTLLGSCVSACLYDPQSRIGGMNHFLLPHTTDEQAEVARYGIHAMELLINRIMTLGGNRRRLRAKAFGGANLLSFRGIKVGSTNSVFVREFLRVEGIPLTAERLEGTLPLAVQFFTATGKAWIKPVQTSALAILARDEEHFAKRFTSDCAPEVGNDVTLF